MTRLGKLLGLIVALCGFAAAHVVVQAGSAMQLPIPTTTVTVPPVPAPTLPVPPPVPPPTTPTVTVPVPPPTVTVPVPPPTTPVPVPPPTTAPVPVPAPPTPPVTTVRPAPPTAPALPPVSTSQPTTPPVTTPSGSQGAPSRPESSTQAAGDPSPPPVALAGSSPGSSFAPASTADSAAGAGAAPRAATRSGALEARRLKTRNRVSVRLTFRLPKADRVFLIVRGPAPSCEIAGYIPVRGRQGINRVTFTGRVQGRRLEPGTYLISLSTSRRLAPGAATEYVRVVSPRRSLPLADSARKPSCNDVGGLATSTAARIALGGFVPLIATPTVQPAQPSRATKPQNGDDADAEASGFIPDAGILGVAIGDAADEPFVAFAVLTLIAALLISMVALVTRFIRGSWNP